MKSRDAAVSARFDAVAGQWDANPSRVALAQAVGQAIWKQVPIRSHMVAMDFGAGTGLLTLALLPHVAAITAVDVSREMLRVLDGKLTGAGLQNVRTLCANIVTDPLPQAAFDLVVSSMAMHHVADVPRALRTLRACLRPGGWIAIADLDAEDGSFHEDKTGVHHSGFDRAVLGAWMAAAGFASIAAQDAYRIDRNGRQYGVILVTGRAA